MDAAFILNAIAKKYPKAAIVPEITIEDFDLPDTDGEAEWYRPAPPPPGHLYSRRIDALMFQSLERTAIEIKVSREDFRRDTFWKRRAWSQVTHRFVYVVPHDLDVTAPHGCGLWKVHENGLITVETKAIVSKTPDALPQTVIQRLAYRANDLRKIKEKSNE
ncbi:hypothetical protein phi16_gp079 [Corynebacterium phage phi16]|nr:hypothetical protein phi16_gp079 [Corynebacterium phage phi16]OKX80515.1 hypothetical protein AUO95_10235 [Corynebacterium glutamicum]